MSPLVLTPRRSAAVLTVLLVVAASSLLLALMLGSVPLAPAALLRGVRQMLGGGEGLEGVLLGLRAQRACAAFGTGAALALSGALMQTLLRNPLAEPYILGLSGGAAVGALCAMLLAGAAWLVDAAAFAGALLSMFIVAGFARRALWSGAPEAEQGSRLLLTGVVLAAGWGALVTLLLALAPDGQLRSMVFWLMGDLGGAEPRVWPLLLGAGVFLVAWRRARALNVLALGQDAARALGLRVDGLRRLLFVCASLLAALSVTGAGSIGFVGLIVPHACRLALGHDHRLLLPAAVLGGGSFLVLADLLARTVLAPQQLPVGVITALIGVPVFLWQLSRERR